MLSFIHLFAQNHFRFKSAVIIIYYDFLIRFYLPNLLSIDNPLVRGSGEFFFFEENKRERIRYYGSLNDAVRWRLAW